MKNKRILFRVGLFIAIMGCFSLSLASATQFKLDIDKIRDTLNREYVSNNIIPIHFADNGNDFGGFFYFSNGIGKNSEEESNSETDPVGTCGNQGCGISIKSGNDTMEYECSRQVKGFYYNAERGERLRPLDIETRAGDITTSGGLFTVCSKSGYIVALQSCINESNDSDPDFTRSKCENDVSKVHSIPGYGYYGQLTHTIHNGQTMVLTVGVNYDTGTSKFVTMTGGFTPSFVRVENKYPVGFIYDQNGGVGFVGCKIDSKGTGVVNLLKNYYYLINTGVENPLTTLFYETGDKIEYTGNAQNYVDVDCSAAVRDSLLGVVIEGIVGMGQSGTVANSEYIGNPQNTNMQFFTSANINSSTIINYARKKAELLCRGKRPQNNNICNNGANNIKCCKGNIQNGDSYIGKTLIVKNGNVTIKPFGDYNNGWKYDIFIDSGNLIIKEGENDTQFVFKRNGFKSDTTVESFRESVSSNKGGSGDDVSIGSFIRGNFIVNGHIKGENGSGLENKYFIHGKVSTRDTFDTLLETFQWRCINGIATNEDYCPLSKGNWINPYQAASLVIIDQNYDSPLLNKK